MKLNTVIKLFSSYKNNGFIKTNYLIKEYINTQYELYLGKKFDLKYSIETRHHIASWDLKIESANKKYAFRYEPIPFREFYSSMNNLQIKFEDYIFIDVGAGKGRALLLASDYPFKELIGIEFSKEIYKIAKNNIEKFKYMSKKANFNLLYEDATKYTFPNENIVLFLYNPFDGKVLYDFINKIRQYIKTTKKDFIIIYHYPMYSKLYDKQSFLELQVVTKEYRIYVAKR